VGDVDHHIHAEVTTDGAFFSFRGVRRAEKGTDLINDVLTAERESHDRRALHEGSYIWEERLASDVGIMVSENGVIKLDHFEAANLEAFGFKALENFAAKLLGNSVGLEENEGGLLGHKGRVTKSGGGASQGCDDQRLFCISRTAIVPAFQPSLFAALWRTVLHTSAENALRGTREVRGSVIGT